MLLCSRSELLPNALGEDIGCGGGGSGAENASRIQMKEDGVQPTLFWSPSETAFHGRKRKSVFKKNKYLKKCLPKDGCDGPVHCIKRFEGLVVFGAVQELTLTVLPSRQNFTL